jgi:hypothetical protein
MYKEGIIRLRGYHSKAVIHNTFFYILLMYIKIYSYHTIKLYKPEP